MLSASDPIGWTPQRVLVAGVAGSGKTTLARRLEATIGLPHTEIDALYHGPNWQPRESFVVEVESFTAEPRWITEWQYRSVRPLLAARADTLVWIDLPTPTTLSRVTRRTLRRRFTREELWNGNREGPLWKFFTDPEHIVRWSIRTRSKYRTLLGNVESEYPHLNVVRLRSQREVDEWLEELRAGYAEN